MPTRPGLEVAVVALPPRRLHDRACSGEIVTEPPLARRPLDDLVGRAAQVAGDARLVLHLPRVIEARVVGKVHRLRHHVPVHLDVVGTRLPARSADVIGTPLAARELGARAVRVEVTARARREVPRRGHGGRSRRRHRDDQRARERDHQCDSAYGRARPGITNRRFPHGARRYRAARLTARPSANACHGAISSRADRTTHRDIELRVRAASAGATASGRARPAARAARVGTSRAGVPAFARASGRCDARGTPAVSSAARAS